MNTVRSSLLMFLLLAMAPAAIAAEPGRPAVTPPTPAILLVASRQLNHPSFRETVILVTRHGRGGPIGVIVNRPLRVTLREIFPSLPEDEARPLHEGGPVERGQLSFVFRSTEQPPGTLAVGGQTFIGRSAELLTELLRGTRQHDGVRVIAGYAGWAPGQLENEIARGDWHVLPVDSKVIFDKPATAIWPELHQRATQTTAWMPGSKAMLISAAPTHPTSDSP